MPHTKSYSSKLKLNKIKLLLIFLGILLISGVVILSTPKGSLDNRNRAQVSADTDIVPAITSGTISLDQPFDIPINVIKTSARSFTISGAQVEISASSRFSFNKDQSHCISPFSVEFKSVNPSTNTLTLMCSIPQQQPSISIPQGAGISFANVNLTMINENPAISARVFFNQKKVIEAGIPNQAPDVSVKSQGIYDFNVTAQQATVPPVS